MAPARFDANLPAVGRNTGERKKLSPLGVWRDFSGCRSRILAGSYAALRLLKLGDTAPYHSGIAENKLERWPRQALWACPQGALGRLIHEDEADVARDTRGIDYMRRSRAVGIYAVRARDILARRLLSGEIAGQHASPVSYDPRQ